MTADPAAAGRYWFLVFGDRDTFGGACFISTPRNVATRWGISKALADAGITVPKGHFLYAHPCPFDFTPPPGLADRLLSEDEWRAVWMSCAPPASS